MNDKQENSTDSIYEERKCKYMHELKDYLDPDFEKSFQIREQRLSCESELIIGHELLSKGYVLCPKGNLIGRPDYLLNGFDRKVWIEVTAPRE